MINRNDIEELIGLCTMIEPIVEKVHMQYTIKGTEYVLYNHDDSIMIITSENGILIPIFKYYRKFQNSTESGILAYCGIIEVTYITGRNILLDNNEISYRYGIEDTELEIIIGLPDELLDLYNLLKDIGCEYSIEIEHTKIDFIKELLRDDQYWKGFNGLKERLRNIYN